MNKPVEFTDEEFAVLNMTAQTIGKDLLSALVDEIRTLPDVWQKLSEQKQSDIIERCTKRVDYNVKRAVHLIASDGRIVVAGDVEQIVIKDGVKAVVKFGKNTANLHHLYESESNAVLVVVANASDFTGGMDDVKPDPDQQDLYGGDDTFAHVGEVDITDDGVVDAEIVALPFSPSFANDKATTDDGEVVDNVLFADSDWYRKLCKIASEHGVELDLSQDYMWFDHSIDKTPEEAFFNVYPHRKPADPADDDHDGSTND